MTKAIRINKQKEKDCEIKPQDVQSNKPNAEISSKLVKILQKVSCN